MKCCAAGSWSARTDISAGGWAASTISSTEIASEPGSALKSWSAATEFSACGWRGSVRSSRKRTDEREQKKKIPSSRLEPPQLLKEMTSSKAFRCVQAWLLEKPAAWADDPCLAAAQMAQRPPAKRPREDALLEAERSHQRRRIELLEEQLLGEEAEVRRLEEQCFAASTDLEEIMSEVSHVSAALHALRWFEAHDTWSGRWDAWDAVLDHGGPEHAGEVRVVEGDHLRAVTPPCGARQVLPLRSCEVV